MRLPSPRTIAIGLAVLVVASAAVAGVITATAPDAPRSVGAALDVDDTGDGIQSGEVNRSDADLVVRGATNDSLGKSAAYAGDVNGDGYDDLVVGAPFTDSSGPQAGAAYLFFGPLGNGTLNASTADLVLYGESPGDEAGWSVAAGDLNDDEYDDLVIGAPFHDGAGGSSGAAYVVYGGANLSGAQNLSAADAKIEGAAAGDFVGYDVAVTDGVLGDGGHDLVVSAPYDNSAGEDAGAVYVIDGNSLGDVDEVGQADLALVGESPGDMAGSSIDVAGDVDGDDRTDLVIGARTYGDAEVGAAYVLTDPNATASNASGANTTHANATMSLANATTRLTGAAAWDRAGWSVAGVGDVNGDGYDDVAVGAPTNDGNGSASGAVHLVFGGSDLPVEGNLSDANVTRYGAVTGERAGWSIAGIGDVTCDGFADVAVGAPRNDVGGTDAGAAYVIAGNGSMDRTDTLANATTRFVGSDAGDSTGWGVSSAGDPARGFGVLVGASDAGDGGLAYLLRSDCPGSVATPTPTATPTSTPTPTSTATPTPTASPTATASPTPTATQTDASPETTTTESTPSNGSATSDDGTTSEAARTGEEELPLDPIAITFGIVVAGSATALLFRRRW